MKLSLFNRSPFTTQHNMKNLMFLFLLGLIGFSACKQEQNAPVDFNALQKSMDADPEVAKLRSLLYSYSRILASIPQPEYDAIISQLHSCGLYGSTASITDLESCLTNMASKDAYIEFQNGARAYDKQYDVVKQRFSEFSQLSHEKQAELLVKVNLQEAEKVLSDYLSNRKK